jgi:hypothetical protein
MRAQPMTTETRGTSATVQLVVSMYARTLEVGCSRHGRMATPRTDEHFSHHACGGHAPRYRGHAHLRRECAREAPRSDRYLMMRDAPRAFASAARFTRPDSCRAVCVPHRVQPSSTHTESACTVPIKR